MFNKKNHIGRPTNEEVKKRKIKKIIYYGTPVFLVALVAVLITTGSFSKLMGNSVTDYYCEDQSYSLDGTNCVKKTIKKAALLGDVDEDGKVTAKDLKKLEEFVAESSNVQFSEFQTLAADIDKNGTLNSYDVKILSNHFSTSNGSSGVHSEQIGIERVCPKDYKLDGDECSKIETKPAVLKNNNSNVNNQEYTIEFDGNGGIGKIEKMVSKEKETVKIPKNTFTNNNKVFLGWKLYNKTTKEKLCYTADKIKENYFVALKCEYGEYVFDDGAEIKEGITRAGEEYVLIAKWGEDNSKSEPILVQFKPQDNNTSLEKNTNYTLNFEFDVKDIDNTYYYVLENYSNDTLKSKSDCTKIVQGEQKGSFILDGTTQIKLNVYSDNSCSNKIKGIESAKYTCSNCNVDSTVETTPVSVKLQTEFYEDVAKKGEVINVVPTFTVLDEKQYYYIWRTYAYGIESYKSNCQEVIPGTIAAKTLTMFAERQGGIQIYDDSSCSTKVGSEIRTKKIPCNGCSPVFATFDEHETTAYKKNTWVYNKLNISVDNTDNQYYYLWKTYLNGKLNYTSSCQKVIPGEVQTKGLYMSGKRYGEVLIYSDSSCKKQVDKEKTQTFTVCSNCDTVDEEDTIEEIISGGSSGDYYYGDDYIIYDDGYDDGTYYDDGSDTSKTCTNWGCPSGYSEWSGSCRKDVKKTVHANKICSNTTCPNGYKFEAGVCRKEVTKTSHANKVCANATCPSGYKFEAGVCRKSVTKTRHENKICTSYKCPSGYSPWSGTCRKEVVKTASVTNECEKATCPSGYNFEAGVCRKSVTKSRHVDKVCASYKCPSGYSEWSGACRKQVTKTRTTGTICKSYRCPSGYSSWSGACRKAVTKTRYASQTCASYKCPSGYSSFSGACRKGNKVTGKVCASYKCPSGYTNSGGTCRQTYTTYDVTSNKVCSQTGCPSGYTYSGGTCRQTYTTYDTTSKKTCSSYKCPSGSSQKGGECFQDYKTYDISSKMNCTSYRCPSGYTKINGKCTLKTYDISSNKTCTAYKCPSGFTQKGGECFQDYKTYETTSKMTCKTYKCPDGYTQKGGECFKEYKAYSITSDYSCKEYKCPTGYSVKGGECFKDTVITDIRSKVCISN